MLELSRQMSSRELTEWMAYYRIEPFGARIQSIEAGIIASTFANASRSKEQRALSPADLVTWADDDGILGTVLSQEEQLERLFNSIGAPVITAGAGDHGEKHG